MANAIHQEEFQAVYDIYRPGPNNFDLAVNLAHSKGNERIDCVDFSYKREDGVESFLPVVLTGLKNVDGKLSMKENWEFEGILWTQGLHVQRNASGFVRARLKGTYNSRNRCGNLYVLAHEQPRPIVEVLPWQEMVERLNKDVKIAGFNGAAWTVEFRKRKNGAMARAYLDDARIQENRVHVMCLELFSSTCDWINVGSSARTIEKPEQYPLPLVLADGRIIFSANGIDYTIYPQGSGAN